MWHVELHGQMALESNTAVAVTKLIPTGRHFLCSFLFYTSEKETFVKHLLTWTRWNKNLSQMWLVFWTIGILDNLYYGKFILWTIHSMDNWLMSFWECDWIFCYNNSLCCCEIMGRDKIFCLYHPHPDGDHR